MKQQNAEKCIRRCIKIEDENYYLILGEKFLMATVPRENDPIMTKERVVVETICQEVTKMLGGSEND